MWNGQNAASGDLNKAAAAHYSGLVDAIGGEMQQKASYFSAAGTLASSGASAYKLYDELEEILLELPYQLEKLARQLEDPGV